MRKRTGAKKRPAPARRSPQAKALGLRLYRPRVVPDKRRKALNGLVQAEAAERGGNVLVGLAGLMEGCRWR